MVHLSSSYDDKVKNQTLLKIARFIESHPVQVVILCLFLLDIAIVLAELILETEILREELFIAETEIRILEAELMALEAQEEAQARNAPARRSRWFSNHHRPPNRMMTMRQPYSHPALRATNETEHHNDTHHNDTHHEEHHAASPSEQKLHDLELAETVLHWISIAILCIFLLELLVLLFIFKQWFFFHFLYVIDLIIVSLSIGLEVGLNNTELQNFVAVIIFLRLWRLVRAGHGVMAIQQEKSLEKRHKLVVKNAHYKADIECYRMEVHALEKLLDELDIPHPNFSRNIEKMHLRHKDKALDPDQQQAVSEWLEVAEKWNKDRVDEVFGAYKEELKRKGDYKRIRDAMDSDDESPHAKESSAKETSKPEEKSTEEDEFEEFLQWKKKNQSGGQHSNN